jgi:hypothetical protein
VTAPGGGNVVGQAIIRIVPQVQNFARQLRRQLHQANSQLRTLQRDLRPINNALRFLARNATGIVPGIKLATASLRALAGEAIVGGLLALGGAAYELAGVLLLIPAGAVAAASAVGTLAVGLSGVKDALKDFDDAEKFGKALEDLSSNAAKTLGVLDRMRDRFDAFKNAVQQALFAGLDRELTNLANKLLPLVQEHFVSLAKIFNRGGKEVSSFLQQASTMKDLRGITDDIEGGFRALLPAIKPAGQAILDIVAVGADFLPEIGTRVSELATKFSEFIHQARMSGQLSQWIQGGLRVFEQLGRTVGNVIVGLHALLSTAKSAGLGLMDSIENASKAFRNFFTSTRGQTAVFEFLENAKSAAHTLIPIIGALASAFFQHLLPALVSIGKILGPSVTAFIHGLGEAIDAARPGIETFARGFSMFLRALTPALPAIGELIGAFGRLVGALSAGLGPAIADVIRTLSAVLVPVLNAVAFVVNLLPEGFFKFVVILGVVIATITGVIAVMRGFISFTTVFASSVGVAATATLGLTRAASGFSAFMRGPWGIAIAAAISLLGAFAIGFSDSSEKQAQAESAARELNDAIREQNGLIDENIKRKAAQQLDDTGALKLANQLGISTGRVTDAYLNQGAALDGLRSQLEGIIEANTRTTTSYGKQGATVQTTVNAQGKAAQELLNILNRLSGARDVDAETQARVKAAADSLTQGLTAQRDAYYGLIDAQTAKANQDFESINTNIGYQRQLASTKAELAEGTKTLSINTKEGQDNLESVTQLAAAGARRIAQLRAEKAPITTINQEMRNQRKAILDLLEPFFKSREAARRYAVQLGLIPRNVNTTIALRAEAAKANLAAFKRALDNLHDRTITINTYVRGANITAQRGAGKQFAGVFAKGGVVPADELAVVGENGPELVSFGRTARVFSNAESRDALVNSRELDRLTRTRSYAAVRGTSTGSTAATATTPIVNVTSNPEIRVFIGDREVKDVVVEVVNARDRYARRVARAGADVRRV